MVSFTHLLRKMMNEQMLAVQGRRHEPGKGCPDVSGSERGVQRFAGVQFRGGHRHSTKWSGLGNNEGSSHRSLGQGGGSWTFKASGIRKGRRVSRWRVVEIARPRRMAWCLWRVVWGLGLRCFLYVYITMPEHINQEILAVHLSIGDCCSRDREVATTVRWDQVEKMVLVTSALRFPNM